MPNKNTTQEANTATEENRKNSAESAVSVTPYTIKIAIGGSVHVLSVEKASQLRDALDAALPKQSKTPIDYYAYFNEMLRPAIQPNPFYRSYYQQPKRPENPEVQYGPTPHSFFRT